MTNIIIVGNYYRVNLFDGTVRSFRYPDDSFFLSFFNFQGIGDQRRDKIEILIGIRNNLIRHPL